MTTETARTAEEAEAAASRAAAEAGVEFLDDDVEEASDPTAALKDTIAQLTTERDQFRDLAQRKAADFDNARRRFQKEKDDLQKYAAERVLRDMLPLLDNLQRALEAAGATGEGDDSLASFVRGVQMVRDSQIQALSRHGVEGFDSVGTAFDPNLHEAVQLVPDESVPHGTVIREFQRGYRLAERLLRPAMVVVAQGGAMAAATEGLAPIDALGDQED